MRETNSRVTCFTISATDASRVLRDVTATVTVLAFVVEVHDMVIEAGGEVCCVLDCFVFRLSRSDRGLSHAADYDEHVLPGEAVLLNGQSSSSHPYKPAPPPFKDDTTTSLYGGGGGGHGCRLNWDDTQRVLAVGDCPSCRDTQAVTDDSEVCFTEELVRRKLLLGRCPSLLTAESAYDTVPMSAAASCQSSEMPGAMRTFNGLAQNATDCRQPC